MNKKIILSVLVMCLSLVTATGFAQNAIKSMPEFRAGQYNPDGELITVTAKGLVCEFCAKALEKVFMRQDEVSGVSVDLTTKEILISLKPGQTMDDPTVEKFIQDAGYNIKEIARSAKEQR